MNNQSRVENLLATLLSGETTNVVPQSRIEKILLDIVNGETDDTFTPRSRIEAYLKAISENGLGGGSSGGGANFAVGEIVIAEDFTVLEGEDVIAENRGGMTSNYYHLITINHNLGVQPNNFIFMLSPDNSTGFKDNQIIFIYLNVHNIYTDRLTIYRAITNSYGSTGVNKAPYCHPITSLTPTVAKLYDKVNNKLHSGSKYFWIAW